MTKVNREVEERIKESFKKGYIKGVLDKEWGQTTADEEIEKVKAQTRNDLLRELLEEIPKKKSIVGIPTEPEGNLVQDMINLRSLSQVESFNEALDQVNTILQSKL